MNEARELIAMKTTIHAALDPEDIPRINFRALVNAAADALARGWTGNEIARHAVEGIYTGEVRELGALMLTNIRPLADYDPPREATPQPPTYVRPPAPRPADHAAGAAAVRAAARGSR